MIKRGWLFLAATVLFASGVFATIFGTVRGIVHDPQHRPVAGASVKIKSATSDWTETAQTDQEGAFAFSSVPLGDYVVSVTKDRFADEKQAVTVTSGSSPTLHFQLKIGTMNETTTVVAPPPGAVENVDSVTPTALVDRQDIAQTPGADRTNSLAMITDYVPAAYVTHDMLHMRGGHQVDWLIDGVPIPNTNIATNLVPQIDPKDIDYLEIQRGSYEADMGDRTYGIFNIVPRTGFERNNEAELVTTFGNWYQTNDQINFGGHTERFAYYASVNGNRSNYGLQTPIAQVFHDAENGYGGFASFIFNPDAKNQLRLVTSLRQDYYQIPFDPDPNSIGNQQLVAGNPPVTAFATASMSRRLRGILVGPHIQSKCCLPFLPFITTPAPTTRSARTIIPSSRPSGSDGQLWRHAGQLNATFWKNDLEAGVYGFAQHESNYFNNQFTDGPLQNFPASSIGYNGGLEQVFFSDKFKVTSVADLNRRLSSIALHCRHHGERDGPALWDCQSRCHTSTGSFDAFYGIFTSPAAADGHRPAVWIGEQQ